MAAQTSPRPTPPSLDELMGGYLQRSVSAAPAADGEVEPYEVAVGFRTEPRVALDGAVAALDWLGVGPGERPRPGEAWAALAASPHSVAALPLAVGHFPQLVRDLTPLTAAGWDELRSARPTGSPSAEYATGAISGLFAAAADRLNGHTDDALARLDALAGTLGGEWSVTLANERAATKWLAGDGEAALADWQAQGDSVPVRFNRGMASLFLGRPAEAAAELKAVIALTSDDDGWAELARLYLALAEVRG